MTKAELEVKVAELTALLAALTAQLAAPAAEEPVVEAPAEFPETPAEVIVDSDGYGPYDSNWCRKYQPLVDLLDGYENDGNRYHEMMVRKLEYESEGAYGYRNRDAVYLIKPATGFVNKDHETFFLKAYNGNRDKAHFLPRGSGFFKGRVFTAFQKLKWSLPWKWVVGQGTEFVPNAECPFAGTDPRGADHTRELFEVWWTKEGVLLWNWSTLVKQVARLDNQYANGSTEESIAKLYPWWRPTDGSPAVF